MPSRLLLLVLLALGPALAARAQRADTTVADGGIRRVVLLDGSVVVGRIEDEGADPLVIRLPNGVEQRVPRAQVREITALYAGRFTRLDPNRSRLFVTPTGRTLGRGSGRFSTFLYLFPGVAYGVTDWLDVSAATTIPFTPDIGSVLNLNVKGQVLRLPPGGGAALGASALVPITGGGVGGTFYGVVTLGSETQALTLGAVGLYGTVFGDEGDDFAVADGALLVGGYERQLSNAIKFISENGLFVGNGEVGGGTLTGVRFFSDRLVADIAAIAFAADGEVFVAPIPYLGLSYSFGR